VSAPDDLFAGGGELGELTGRRDWSATPLGPVEGWPRALRTCVRIMLTSRQPMFIWWGDELINLYNDAYRTIVGGKHPVALGQPASVVWREIWDSVGPRAASAMQQNEGTYDEALLLIMHRYGYPEETYYTFSYSPVPNDEGGTGGILCANTDDTQRIIGERRLALLRELAAGAGEARTVRDAFALSARALATGSRDLPFALLYLHEPERNRMVLAGAAGLPPGHPAAPPAVELDAIAPWPLGDVLRTGALQEITDFSQVGTLPTGAWDRPPSRAVALPLSPSGESGRAGVFVAGLNPYRLFDDDYRGFLELVAAQIAGAMVNAQAYEDERERAEALAELDRAKTAFFSNVSHEFRTPLTLLLGPLEEVLVRWDPGAAPGERALIHTAHRNGLRLLKLVNTLLDFARIEAGRARASYHPTDLPSLTAELASSFQSAVERTGLRFEVRCPPLAEPVWVDRDMWEKIVLNLVSNAFKFTFDGGITVELREVDREAVLTVEDTGTGIPAADLPRLFERFHRVEGSRGRTHEGTGIGLALVQELTRLHGGGVTVESEVGRGSQFKVRIPLGTAHLPAEQLESGAPPSATATRAEAYVEEALRWLPASGEGPPAPDPAEVASAAAILPSPNGPRARVVVADDNADMREYVGRLLGEHYDVLLAGNGKEALRLVREEPVDLVLSDVMMPLLDGFGLLRALRGHPDTERLPVILLSARAGEEAKVEGLEARADDYIVKPFAARELLARVSAALHLARVREEASAALRESEERYRSLTEATSQVVWTMDADGRWRSPSPSFERYTGLTWEEYRDGSGRAVHPADHARVTGEWATILRSASPGEIRFRFRRADGAYRRAISRAVPLRQSDGDIREWVGTITDMEDQLQAEERLRQAAKMEAIGRLAGGLAHDFNNQLQGIAGFATFVDRDPGLSARARQDVHEIRKAAERMAGMTQQLLAFSRQQVLVAEVLDLNAAVADSQSLLQRLIGSSIEMVVQLAPGPKWVQVDRAQLLQVLMNLAINARDAMPGGGELVVRTATRTSVPEAGATDGPYAALMVSDSGSGISPEHLPHIFEPFFTTKETGEGTGLGLATVHGIVSHSRGQVWAESKPDKGTTFIVLLPLTQEPSRRDAAPARAIEQARPATVLVVDDEDIIRSLMKRTLEEAGYEVLLARNGREALDSLARHRGAVDLVLSDLVMPVMGGRELANRLAAEHPGLPVVWVSGHPKDMAPTDRGSGLFLQKPLSPDVLVETVARALERRGVRRPGTAASPEA
jgi:PAS domain S-box-containing protein